jgi:hypothetical protein
LEKEYKMSKTIQTNLRLTEEERDYLKALGNGDISQGVREALLTAGYKEKNSLTIYRIEVINQPGDYFYYRYVSGMPGRSMLAKRGQSEFTIYGIDEIADHEAVARICDVLYGEEVEARACEITLVENGEIVKKLQPFQWSKRTR